MALKFTIAIPLFLPTIPIPSDHRPTTEIRFSRWNNANAQKFVRQERAQKEIEDEIRFHKRFNSADKITELQPKDNRPSSENEAPRFRSTGTPSSPSRPSIPGKASKYSKAPKPENPHPAFRPLLESRKLFNLVAPAEKKIQARLNITEKGVSYVIPGAPFEFQYSYTETPKVKPLKLREAPYAPFGPTTMPRPWTGRAPLPPSKKKLMEFDSFRLPPPHKKGVKPVQAPGPYLPGSGPKYVMSREEIMGEPLTKEETKELIIQGIKTTRQLNIGRDGLTHNMLDNIHSLWKRRRVCKIKCKGVCTVDMDNVRQQLEERTGGKIIFSRGGVIYLFRGRNYNFRTRPRFPLMLWKPITPLYPRLVKQAPDGLSLEEAKEMRKKGRKLMPICKLGKNGVYCKLVKTVREAFEECELVRINCQGLHSSDYHRIGAKLMDLVPCVLVSFEHEHILMWRGRDWKSSMVTPDDHHKESDTGNAVTEKSSFINESRASDEDNQQCSHSVSDDLDISRNPIMSGSENLDIQSIEDSPSDAVTDRSSFINNSRVNDDDDSTDQQQCAHISDVFVSDMKPFLRSNPAMEEVKMLLKKAVEIGSAVVLDSDYLDADMVYEQSVSLARSAPPEPVFKKHLTGQFKMLEKKETDALEGEVDLVKKENGGKRKSLRKKIDFRDEFPSAALPQGSLAIDELAKLLA